MIVFVCFSPGFYSGTGSATYTNRLSPSSENLENCKLFSFDQADESAWELIHTLFIQSLRILLERNESIVYHVFQVLTLETPAKEREKRDKQHETNRVIALLREKSVKSVT